MSHDPERVRLARVALGHLAEPGSRDLGELVRQHGPVEAMIRLQAGQVPDRLAERTAARLATGDPYRAAERAIERAVRLGARIVTPEDAEYPSQLEDLVHISEDGPDRIRRDTYPPQCVWLRGPLTLAEACERSVAVVGARASTGYGDHVGSELAYGLAERGWAVVSGGAFGIDGAAHRGALAANGATVAVLACGIDRPYPTSHASLFDRIGECGLLVSEWPPGADPFRNRFLVRNRLIAAATRGTVMVEASLRSGALFTLRRARDLNRIVMAVPGPVTSAVSVGCHAAVRDEGALLVTGVDHVVEAVGHIGDDLAPPARSERRELDALSPLAAQVLDGVRARTVLTAEEIAAMVGVGARDARRALPMLVAAGYVSAVGPGYRLARRPRKPGPAGAP